VGSDEAGPIGRLLEAYEQGDQEKVAAIVASPLFRSLENDVCNAFVLLGWLRVYALHYMRFL
jgi:hypothetical protein